MERIEMNLRERWEKQNNSVKLLLKKLRRHDTFVVAVAVVIALVLCGGLIYMSTPVVAASARDQVVEKESKNNEKTTEKLDELHEYLTDLDKMIVKNQKGIDSYYEKTKNDRLSDEKTTNDVNEKVSGMGTNLKNIHSTVNATESRIESLKELIESGNGENRDKVSKEFDKINSDLDDIQKEYENLKNQNKELIDELDKEIRKEVKNGDEKITNDTSARYADLFDKLSRFDEELQKRDTESVSDLKKEFTSLSEALGERIDEKIDNYSSENKVMGDKINEKLENYNIESKARGDRIDEKIEIINSEMNADMAGLKGYIDEKSSGINTKLDQVFQRVSNGKRLLASALLTKGVKINEDATFTEFVRAIENIPSQVVIDSGDTAASIVYDYHYHTDGKGKTCGDNIVSGDRKGGCYNTPVYHRHSSACYKTINVYRISTKKDTHTICHVKDYHDGTPVFSYECTHCGAKFNNTNPSHEEIVYSIDEVRSRNGKLVDIITQTKMVCNKSESYIEGYVPSCGYAHGQVVSAHIKFNGRNSKYNSTVPAIDTSRSLNLQSISANALMKPFEDMDLQNYLMEEQQDDVTDIEEEDGKDNSQTNLQDISEAEDEKENVKAEDVQNKDVQSKNEQATQSASSDSADNLTISEETMSTDNALTDESIIEDRNDADEKEDEKNTDNNEITEADNIEAAANSGSAAEQKEKD